MLVYLNEAMIELKQSCFKYNKRGNHKAIYKGAVLRLRIKLMTLFTILGLIPIVYRGVGIEVMQNCSTNGGRNGYFNIFNSLLFHQFLYVNIRKKYFYID